MKKIFPLFAVVALVSASNMFLKEKPLQDTPLKPCAWDPNSYANCDQILTTHFHLDIKVDFTQSSLIGTNTINLTATADGVNQVILDYQGLTVSKVEQVNDQNQFVALNYASANGRYGNALIITLGSALNNNAVTAIRVTYATNNEARAMNWLTKEQTATKVLQYLFTQCEPIECRSLAPLQDTPSIKAPYSANVTVVNPYVVKMSAHEYDPVDNKDGTTTFRFHQDIKVPSYLLAIAVGNLAVKQVGPRASVIAEPGEKFLDFYANELKNLSGLLDMTEEYLTPYIWGNYAILVLPPSFPYGGMENPLLTFASPTIIVGDGSQVYVATHEIAHSWTGNEVTCKDWSNMWMNEGFTVFEERKVSERVHGTEFAKIEAQLGNVSLWDDMNGFGLTSNFSSLYPILTDASPDDSFSEVPYEKGFQFLTFLESLFKTKEDFQDLIRHYILWHSEQSVTYLDFKDSLEKWVNANYTAPEATALLGKINWDAWVKAPGANPPNNGLDFTTAGAQAFENLADVYISLKGDASPDNYTAYKTTDDPQLQVIFLNRLTDRIQDVTYTLLAKIDADLNVTLAPNPEIGQRWFPLAIALKYNVALDAAHHYVSYQGRMKYILPIYQSLVANGRRDLAYQWFIDNQNFYHPIALAKVRSIVLSGAISESEKEMLARAAHSIKSHAVIY